MGEERKSAAGPQPRRQVSPVGAQAASATPASERAHRPPLLGLQRSAGNRAVNSLLAAQPALEVGRSDDPLEHEADQVARQVVGRLFASDAGGDAIEPETHLASAVRRRAEPAAAEMGPAGGTVAPETEAALDHERGGGAPLAPTVRRGMEDAFGADFSQVRVHTGGRSAALSRELGATAFTLGSDIFFRGNVPDASSASGAGLLAHELTHVVQQGGAARRVLRRKTAADYKRVAQNSDPKIDVPAEREEKQGYERPAGGGKGKVARRAKGKDSAVVRRDDTWTAPSGPRPQAGGTALRPGGHRGNNGPQNNGPQNNGPQNNAPQNAPQNNAPQNAPQDAGPQNAPQAPPQNVAATTSVFRQAPGPNTKNTAKGAWGCVDTETVAPTLSATLVGDTWKAQASAFQGNYGKIVTLVKGCKEVTKAERDDDKSSDQIFDLWKLGDYRGKWYMLRAVDAHESVHESRVDPALAAVAPQLQQEFAKLEVKQSKKVNTADAAVRAIMKSGAYKKTCKQAREIWDAKYVQLIKDDHAALTPAAEHAVVDPMIRKLNQDRVSYGLAEWWPKGWTG